MEYEYASLVNLMTLGPGAEDATDNELQQEMGVGIMKLIRQIQESLPKLKGGGWEIVSHDVTPFGRRLLTTFLIRRPKQ